MHIVRTLNGATKTKQLDQIVSLFVIIPLSQSTKIYSQWFLEPADAAKSLFFIKTQANGGGYIGVNGTPQIRSSIIITPNKVQWQIRPDAADKTVVRFVS